MQLHMSRERLRELVKDEPEALITAGGDRIRTLSERADEDDYRSIVTLPKLFAGLSTSDIPVSEIVNRGWLALDDPSVKPSAEYVMNRFIEKAKITPPPAAFLRRTIQPGASDRDFIRTTAVRMLWLIRVLETASSSNLTTTWEPNTLTRKYLRELAKLSTASDGPLRAVESLHSKGIVVIFEDHLSYSKLDGAATLTESGVPVIGLTLRYDRLDSFWFTLLHELGHVMLHLTTDQYSFFDDMENVDEEGQREKEANFLAREALVPSRIWNRSPAARRGERSWIKFVAERAEVHPAIVAGRYRYENKRFDELSDMVDPHKIRSILKSTRSG